MFLLLTRLKLKRGEGNLVVAGPQVGTRTRRAHLPQSPPQISPQIISQASTSMPHEGGPDNMLEDEKAFRKSFFNMTQMVKFLYEERNTRLQGESSKPPKGEGSLGGKRGDEDKPPNGMVTNHF